MLKLLYIKIINPLLKFFFSFFFDKNLLKGKYFDSSHIGWKWVIRSFITQRIFGINKNVRWPVSSNIAIDNPAGIHFHPDDLNNFQHFGCYFSNCNNGNIFIGKGTWIAPNVGIITTNHNVNNLNTHDAPKDVILGESCWIGMNAIILPGVTLGNNTIVGAGSVVTKSFPDGNCVVVGNPAKQIKKQTEN
ncbi:DapH/DapD/GlmU-related protein [Flavobacterium sp. YO64]|uniref:DapH/DapD/GlmU-related protein n=1 Tax=Flavobacterium sp. YO64 TaxID=394559 RepID=UPI00100ADBB5|nr:DapH/DapD/GlmU-related protein [Flavobacterium sp. YO64]RXM43996.1 acyltransferase [Flavobacterium sp. YO64]